MSAAIAKSAAGLFIFFFANPPTAQYGLSAIRGFLLSGYRRFTWLQRTASPSIRKRASLGQSDFAKIPSSCLFAFVCSNLRSDSCCDETVTGRLRSGQERGVRIITVAMRPVTSVAL